VKKRETRQGSPAMDRQTEVVLARCDLAKLSVEGVQARGGPDGLMSRGQYCRL
jgi:hypothetical protein